MMKDYYYILGVAADCAPDTIKEAYRKLSKKLHPDLNQGDQYFENKFKDVNEAFETLRDPAKRAKYDAEFKKIKPTTSTSEENINRQYRAKPSDFKRYMRKGPGIGMTIVLILITLIFGDYLVRSFGTVKKTVSYTPTAAGPTVATAADHIYKKHKKKHIVKSEAVAPAPEKPTADAIGIALAKPLPIKTELTPPLVAKQVTIKPVAAKLIANKDGSEGNSQNDFLYATYVLPNVTGVVNLRAYNQYNSSIVTIIPAKSRVLVLEKGGTYYRVFYNKNIGYVPKWSLQMK